MGRLVLLPCHSITFVMLLLDLCLLGSFRPTMYFSFIQFKLPGISIGLILIPFWAFSAHFIHLGILDPLHSFGHPRPISFLYFHGLLLNISGFPSPITISFTFGVCWPLHQPLILIHFFGLSWARLLFVFLGYFFTILYACGPLFLPFELNGFFFPILLILLSLLFVILLGFFLPLTLFFFAKMGLNKG